MKDGENGTGSVARLELSDEGMCTKVFIGAFLIFTQGIVDDELEVGDLDGG